MAVMKNEPKVFPFDPMDFGWVMRKDRSEAEVASAFRQLVYELMTKDFKEGSVASKMHDEAMKAAIVSSNAHRASVNARWRKLRSSNRVPLPQWEEFQNFVNDNELDYEDAHQWWDMTVVDRKGYDRDGNPIMDWRSALVGFCESKKRNRDNES